MIPKSVLDAGRKTRSHLRMICPVAADWYVQSDDLGFVKTLFSGTKTNCQDFIDEEVFLAMFQALAYEYGKHGAVETETKLLEILGD